MLATTEKKNKLMVDHHEIILFIANVDNSDPVVREFMQIKRKRALDRLKASQDTTEYPYLPSLCSPK